MKTAVRVGLLLGALLAGPAQVHAWCICVPPLPHLRVDCSCHCHFRVYCDHGPPVLPWYLYYPYDPHMQMPAPVSPFPNWHGPTAAVPVAPALPTYGAWQMPAPPQLQPVGYTYPQAPSYWYNR